MADNSTLAAELADMFSLPEAKEEEPVETPAEEPPAEEPPAEEPKDELAELRAEIERLKAEREKPEEEGEEKPEEPQLSLTRQLLPDEESFSEVFSDYEKGVEFLEKLETQLTERIMRLAVETSMQSMARQAQAAQVQQKFWEENDDLKEHVELLRVTAADIASRNPDLPPEELLKRTARVVRAELDLYKTAAEKESKAKQKPEEEPVAFARAGGRTQRRTPSHDQGLQGVQKEVAELLDI